MDILRSAKWVNLCDGVRAGGAGAPVGLQGFCIPLSWRLSTLLICPILGDRLHTHTQSSAGDLLPFLLHFLYYTFQPIADIQCTHIEEYIHL